MRSARRGVDRRGRLLVVALARNSLTTSMGKPKGLRKPPGVISSSSSPTLTYALAAVVALALLGGDAPAGLPPAKMHFSRQKCIFHGKNAFFTAKICIFQNLTTLDGSFSAVSTPLIARVGAFVRIFQNLEDLHSFAPLQTQNFTKICQILQNFGEFSRILRKFQQNQNILLKF